MNVKVEEFAEIWAKLRGVFLSLPDVELVNSILGGYGDLEGLYIWQTGQEFRERRPEQEWHVPDFRLDLNNGGYNITIVTPSKGRPIKVSSPGNGQRMITIDFGSEGSWYCAHAVFVEVIPDGQYVLDLKGGRYKFVEKVRLELAELCDAR